MIATVPADMKDPTMYQHHDRSRTQDMMAPQNRQLQSAPRTSMGQCMGLGLMICVLGSAARMNAADGPADMVKAKDALVINKGTYACSDDSLKPFSRYAIAGTFFSNLYVSPKFPCGGAVVITGGARLNPAATLEFQGGYLFLDGSKGAIAETVTQIQFQSGTSEIRLENGNVSLRSSDPAGGLLRKQGATVMVGGDGKGDFDLHKSGYDTALGATGMLRFGGGMATQLKGGGGAPGSTNQSIIPWMTIGTYQNPGVSGMATYDSERGVRGLQFSDYDTKLPGTPDRNVWVDNVTLGKGVSQTVNAMVFRPYYGMELGAGSTLTITSGFLQFLGSGLSGPAGPSAIGFHPHKEDWLAVAGTIDFGPAEGVIWSNFDGKLGTNIIGAVLAGSGGVTFSGTNTLILLAANTYTGRTTICSGILQLGDVIPNQARLGKGDLTIAAGGTLHVAANVVHGLPAAATVTLLHAGSSFYGVMDLEAGIRETVAGLIIDGKGQAPGTYGGVDSMATHKLERYFTGPGVLTVTVQAADAP
jgi:autotransporter-associated beta strand protein